MSAVRLAHGADLLKYDSVSIVCESIGVEFCAEFGAEHRRQVRRAQVGKQAPFRVPALDRTVTILFVHGVCVLHRRWRLLAATAALASRGFWRRPERLTN